MAGAADYVDGTYFRLNPDWHVPDSAWKVRQILKILHRNGIHPSTVYDVGCGAGEVLRLLQQNLGPACELWGRDVSPQAIELCHARANEKLHFGLTEPRSSGQPFDLVMSLDVLAHAEDFRGLLRSIKAQGTFKLMQFELDISVQQILRPKSVARSRKQHAHLHSFWKQSAMFALEDLGYEIIDWSYSARAIDLWDYGLGRIRNLPRKLVFAVNQDLAASLLGGFDLLVLAK